MPHIDTDLREQMAQAADRPVPVLITCEGQCKPIIKALTQDGIRVTSTGSTVLGIIGAEITSDQLETIKSIKGVSAIEYDQEVEIEPVK